MKRIAAVIITLAIMLTFVGCDDYYKDEDVHITHNAPDSMGIVEYKAGISTEKNAARLLELQYRLQEITDNHITIKLPETIKNSSGKKYKIDSFGGSTGVNAPTEYFGIIINIEEGAVDESVKLTIGAGALPLDTMFWSDIQIRSMSGDTAKTIAVEDVEFVTDEPLSFYLNLKERDTNGETASAMYSDKWYKTPEWHQIGGEKVTLKVKRPEGEISRVLHLNNTPLEPAKIHEKYIQFEFVMPYHGVTIIIVDTKPTKNIAYI